jgi:hypothetical protein
MTAPVRRAIADQVGGHPWEQAEGQDQPEELPIAESDIRRRHSCRFCLATYSNVIHTERCDMSITAPTTTKAGYGLRDGHIRALDPGRRQAESSSCVAP